MIRLAIAFAVLPGLVLAGLFDGVYKQTANAECFLVGVDGGSLQIKDDIFYGVGMECRMANPVQVVDMEATLYNMQCAGEDAAWSERAMVMNDKESGGLIMIWNGYAFRDDRCADDAN